MQLCCKYKQEINFYATLLHKNRVRYLPRWKKFTLFFATALHFFYLCNIVTIRRAYRLFGMTFTYPLLKQFSMKTNRKWMPVIFLGISVLFTQCDKAKDVEPDNENELITTVQLKFTESGASAPQTFTYRDVDGDGGNAPSVFEKITLKPNTTYALTVELKDESKTPAEDISEEVREEADEHLFVFTPSPASLLTYTYGDQDSRNFPIGLTGTAKTGAAGTGKLKVQLRHQPPVSGNAVKNGTPGPGSDDVNLDFDLEVK